MSWRSGANSDRDDGERRNQSGSLEPAGTGVAQLGIEYRQHPSLEILASCHGEGHNGRSVMPHGSHDVEQMLGVIAWTCAARQCEVVTRALALGAQMFCGCPDERVKPVERAGNPSERVAHEVVASHVGELVQQYRTAPVERPVVAFSRQHDCRTKQTAGEGHSCFVAAQQARGLFQLESVRNFPQRREPVLRVEWQ